MLKNKKPFSAFAQFILITILFSLTIQCNSKLDKDEIFDEYSIIKKETIPYAKASYDIHLNKEFNKSSIEKLAHKLKNDLDADYERVFITYYLPGMEVGSGAWATSHFTPNLEIHLSAPFYDDTITDDFNIKEEKEVVVEEKKLSKAESTIEKLKASEGDIEILGKWKQKGNFMFVIFRKSSRHFLTEINIDKPIIGDKWELETTTKSGKQAFIVKDFKQKGYTDYYQIENNGELSLNDRIGIIDKYTIFK